MSSRAPSQADYKKYEHREHIYNVPDMYVGSHSKIEREEFLYDFTSGKISKYVITLPSAIERLFIEIASNSSDNVGRSRRAGVEPGYIKVEMDNRRIRITNSGLPIPIEIHKTEGIYVPEMIFGSLLTGSNYETKREGAGRNGLGAKLVNVFSKYFSVEVYDQFNHKHLKREWYDNMLRMGPASEPQLYAGQESFVIIEWELDFARFEYTEYPDEAFMLFAKYCADISFANHVPVFFNKVDFEIKSAKDYALLCFSPEIVATSILHYEWPRGTEVQKVKINLGSGNPSGTGSGSSTLGGITKQTIEVSSDSRILPAMEVCILDTPDAAEYFSFVNSMVTKKGGVHLQNVLKVVGAYIVSLVNGGSKKGVGTKGNKAKSKNSGTPNGNGGNGGTTAAKSPTIKITDVKPHLSVIVSCNIVDPIFDSQSKTELTAPSPPFKVDDEELKGIGNWVLIDRLYQTLESKKDKSLSSTDGKKKRYIKSLNGKDANEAGDKQSHKCVLFLIEGKSASAYSDNMIANLPGNFDFYGSLPLKGKPLNAMKASKTQIGDNKEFNEIKKYLGLREGADYLDEREFKTLRYGSVVILADADEDGKHITGLVLNFFFCRFPSLLQRGFVMILRTPILRAFRGSQVEVFYNEQQYLKWKQDMGASASGWTIMYYKGLGTSTEEDVKYDCKNPRYVKCLYDEKTPRAMELAFSNKMENQRKEWLSAWTPVLDIGVINMISISEFIDKELAEYGVANFRRSIPSLLDGIKTSQRKILWGVYKKWGWKIGKGYERFKVERLSSHVATETGYHHGEQCLSKAIIGMAQDFVGSNNLPLLTRDGQFGTRYEGGEDASKPRYLHTRPEWSLPYIFRSEDIPLLELRKEEGEIIEPVTFLPILPLQVINGSHGIGTGWSSFIPNHSPLDVIEWLRGRIRNTKITLTTPFLDSTAPSSLGNVPPSRSLPNSPRNPPGVVSPRDVKTIPSASENVEESSRKPGPSPIPTKLIELLPWYRGFEGSIKLVEKSKSKGKSKVVIIDEEDEVELLPGESEEFLKPVDEEGKEEEEEKVEELAESTPRSSNGSTPNGSPRDFVSGSKVSMITEGEFHMRGNSIIITELPIGRWSKSYKEWIESLQDDKIITGYKYNIMGTSPTFEIQGFNGAINRKNLKLRRTYGVSNMVLLDQSEIPRTYNRIADIMEAFYDLRLPWYGKRKAYQLKTLDNKIKALSDKALFIKEVNEGRLEIRDRPQAEVIEGMLALSIEDPKPLLKNTKAHDFTHEKYLKILEMVEELKRERNEIEKTPIEDIWLKELLEFENAYKRYYKY